MYTHMHSVATTFLIHISFIIRECRQKTFVTPLRGSVHTQTATLNVKLTLILKTHPPSLLTAVVAYLIWQLLYKDKKNKYQEYKNINTSYQVQQSSITSSISKIRLLKKWKCTAMRFFRFLRTQPRPQGLYHV